MYIICTSVHIPLNFLFHIGQYIYMRIYCILYVHNIIYCLSINKLKIKPLIPTAFRFYIHILNGTINRQLQIVYYIGTYMVYTSIGIFNMYACSFVGIIICLLFQDHLYCRDSWLFYIVAAMGII